MIVKILFAILITLLTSCVTNNYFETEETIEPADSLVELLSSDVMATMQNNFPPAKTRVFFPHGKERLARALEDGLRKNGYALVTTEKEKKPGDIHFGYKLDSINAETIVLRLVAGEGFQSNRFYMKQEDGSFTSGPLLIRKDG
jgi:hypothetical protein